MRSRRAIVFMGREPETFKADLVGFDHFNGIRMAVEHLISKGHRRIGIIPGPLGQPFSQSRIRGWQKTLQAAGLEADERYASFGDYTVAGGQAAVAPLLDLPQPPTAILAGNLHVVIGVLQILRQRKIARAATDGSDLFARFRCLRRIRPASVERRTPGARTRYKSNGTAVAQNPPGGTAAGARTPAPAAPHPAYGSHIASHNGAESHG